MKACAQPGCPRLVRRGRCPDHLQGGWDRRPRAARGYGSAWDVLRLLILKRDAWICQAQYAGCTRVAREVDHIKSRARGGSDHAENLRAICSSCHKQKTLREGRNKRLNHSGITNTNGSTIVDLV
jgi:5-methylcytosine-specific restriction protein A